ncbi:MAG: M20/M25/M40 family metallo-hydrolase, partial [Omnitrophica WOR_2 bacterium]
TGVAGALGCQSEIDLKPLTPAVVNSEWVTQTVQSVAETLLPGNEIDRAYRTMGSEDMAFFLREVPGCFYFVGSANPEKSLDAPHHHPRFDFDEDVLPRAAALMAAAAVALLTS